MPNSGAMICFKKKNVSTKVIPRRGPLSVTLSLLSSLNHLSSASSTSLLSDFRNLHIIYLFCENALIILLLFFEIIWIIEFTRPNLRHTSAFFPPIFYLSYQFNFFFDAQNFPFVRDCSHVITLPVS
jgi:hypothetical protein